MNYVIGIDEAGRGPLAGPVAVGAVKISAGFNRRFFRDIKDSKKLSAEKREAWFARAVEARKNKKLDFAVALVSERVIDKKGIAHAIRLGTSRCLAALGASADAQIFLDGALKAPEHFKKQKTIIKGDEKIPLISLASICAKVTRDRHMLKMAKKYPAYGFGIHKGYGTLAHRQAIKKYAPCAIHRWSFLKGFDVK